MLLASKSWSWLVHEADLPTNHHPSSRLAWGRNIGVAWSGGQKINITPTSLSAVSLFSIRAMDSQNKTTFVVNTI